MNKLLYFNFKNFGIIHAKRKYTTTIRNHISAFRSLYSIKYGILLICIDLLKMIHIGFFHHWRRKNKFKSRKVCGMDQGNSPTHESGHVHNNTWISNKINFDFVWWSSVVLNIATIEMISGNPFDHSLSWRTQ